MRKKILTAVLLGTAIFLFGFDHRRAPDGAIVRWSGAEVEFSAFAMPAGMASGDAIQEALAAWDVPCSGLGIFFGGVTETPPGHVVGEPPTPTIAYQGDWSFDPGAIALTIVVNDTAGKLRDADVFLNGLESFSTGTATPTKGQYDLVSILTHEVGHGLGLAHSEVSNAVMDPAIGTGEMRRTLTADDMAGICSTYPMEQVAGCSCTAVSGGSHRGWWLLVLGVGVVFGRKRRRQG